MSDAITGAKLEPTGKIFFWTDDAVCVHGHLRFEPGA